MSVTRTELPAHRLEKALAAYIRGFRDPNSDDSKEDASIELGCVREGDLFGLNVYEGRTTSQRSYPCVIVITDRADQMFPGEDFYEVRAVVELHTHRNEAENDVKRAEVEHAYRAKALDDLINRDSLLKAGINKPGPAITDTRDVTDITIIGSYLESHSGDVEGGAIVERFEFMFTVAPWDAA